MSPVTAIYRHGKFEPLQPVDLHEVQQVELSIAITSNGPPSLRSRAKPGSARGKIIIAPDFDAPLPEFLELME